MQQIRISGRVYQERPPGKNVPGGDARRLQLIVQSLKYAAETCTETERRLYKSILEVLAHAENRRDQLRGARPSEPTLADLGKHELEP